MSEIVDHCEDNTVEISKVVQLKKKMKKMYQDDKVEFKDFKEKYEGRIVFISNRDASTIKATRNNLDNLGLLFEDDVFLLRKDKRDTKIVRRNEVLEGIGRMQSYGPNSVIAYFGDQIGDFPNDTTFVFSLNKFMFPNPMYGNW